jgi:hypothetical protein
MCGNLEMNNEKIFSTDAVIEFRAGASKAEVVRHLVSG